LDSTISSMMPYQLFDMSPAMNVSTKMVDTNETPTNAVAVYTAIRSERKPCGINHQKKATRENFGK
jgi:hypothetical protein